MSGDFYFESGVATNQFKFANFFVEFSVLFQLLNN